MLDEVRCTGTEPSLANCSSLGWMQSNCRHDEDASVICTNGEWGWGGGRRGAAGCPILGPRGPAWIPGTVVRPVPRLHVNHTPTCAKVHR